MWYVGGSRPVGAQVGRFFILGYSCSTQRFPRRKSGVYKSLNRVLIKRDHPRIRVNPFCTKEGPGGEQCSSTDKATLYIGLFCYYN